MRLIIFCNSITPLYKIFFFFQQGGANLKRPTRPDTGISPDQKRPRPPHAHAEGPSASSTSAAAQDSDPENAGANEDDDSSSRSSDDDEELVHLVRLSVMATSELLEIGKSLLHVAESLPSLMVNMYVNVSIFIYYN